jgi:hypothetical protein
MRRLWPLAKRSARHDDARHQALTQNPSETQRELGLVSSEQGEVCSTDLLAGSTRGRLERVMGPLMCG